MKLIRNITWTVMVIGIDFYEDGTRLLDSAYQCK